MLQPDTVPTEQLTSVTTRPFLFLTVFFRLTVAIGVGAFSLQE